MSRAYAANNQNFGTTEAPSLCLTVLSRVFRLNVIGVLKYRYYHLVDTVKREYIFSFVRKQKHDAYDGSMLDLIIYSYRVYLLIECTLSVGDKKIFFNFTFLNTIFDSKYLTTVSTRRVRFQILAIDGNALKIFNVQNIHCVYSVIFFVCTFNTHFFEVY